MAVVHLKDLVFRHQSSDFFKTLHPISYEKIALMRDSEEYMKSRKNTEEHYKHLLNVSDTENSFLYATVVGFHKMEHPSTYPGYTYYFKLDGSQIKQTVFEVVDSVHNMEAEVGLKHLEKALNFWMDHEKEMTSYEDPVAGLILPRVEVVIPYSVKYNKYVTQIEDR